MIEEGKIIEVRERASVVEVLSDFLTLRKVGRNYLGLCPFHAEKTPSFTVNEEKGIFHCFGCGVGGNVFHFLMQYDHLTFPEAVERVGRRYGIVVQSSERPGAKRAGEERETLYRLNERATAYFHEALFGRPEGKRALDYLKSRGVDEGSARRFFLGYAHPASLGLAELLKKENLSLKDAVRLGLVSDRGSGHYGDKFLDRLIFPIVNPAGKTVGFGGRVIGDGLPKYLNSAETPLFRKGSNLYGLYQAREAIRKTDRVVIVEGYLDVIALSQFDIAYVVATLGTALTPDHVRILGRYTRNIIALFDGDEAGGKAAARSFEIFLEGGLLGKAAFLPKGEDPDTFVHSKGKEAMESVIDQAVPLADYYFSWLEAQYGRGLEGKSQIAKEIGRVLTKVRNPFEVDILVRRAVDLLGIREELLRLHARPMESRVGSPISRAPKEDPKEGITERTLMSLVLRFPSMMEILAREEDVHSLVGSRWRELFERILLQWKESGSVDGARLAQGLTADQASQISALILEAESIPEEESGKMTADCLAHLRKQYLKGRGKDLLRAIRIAEEKKDEKAKRERMLEWQDVVQKERQLDRQRITPRRPIP
jgi:DNA primase